MSRRDTIIIAVLINACLLVILFATSVTKKEEQSFVSDYNKALLPSTPEVKVQDVQRDFSIDSKPLSQSYPLRAVKVEEKQIPKFPQRQEVVAQSVNENKPKSVEVTVKSGDYLQKIARENNVSVAQIMSANNLKNSQLKIGQVLKIPLDEATKKSPPKKKVHQYIVKNGDTAWKIASDHKMQLDELLRINHLDKESSRHLKPGDTLLIH